MKIKTLCTIALAGLLAMCLCACGNGAVEIKNPETGISEYAYLAETLPDQDRAELDAVLSAFELALETQSATELMQFVNASFTADDATLTAFFKGVTEDGSSYAKYDDYYVSGMKVEETPVLIKKTAESENSVQVVPAGKEMYVALYAGDTSAKVNSMISLVCTKQGGNWYIAWIDISDYQYNGEDAPALYARAKAAYEKGEVMPALVLAQMTASTATPGNALYYASADAIQEFVYEVATEGLKDYPLPMSLSVSGVTLRSVATAKTEYGVIPMFFYSSETPIANRAAIEKEATRVYRAIGKTFPGTIEAFPQAELRVTNDDPETNENFEYETILVSLD